MSVYSCHSTGWEVRGHLQEPVLSLYHVSPRNQSQVASPHSRHLYPLNYYASPVFIFFKSLKHTCFLSHSHSTHTLIVMSWCLSLAFSTLQLMG